MRSGRSKHMCMDLVAERDNSEQTNPSKQDTLSKYFSNPSTSSSSSSGRKGDVEDLSDDTSTRNSESSSVSESPYKNSLSEIKAISLGNDEDDFTTPEAIRKVSKVVQFRPPRPQRKTKSNRKSASRKKSSVQKTTIDNFLHTDVNPDHLQMALALSESSYKTENPDAPDLENSPVYQSTQERLALFKETLEQYGVRCGKRSKLAVEDKRVPGGPPKRYPKTSKFRFVTPTLLSRTAEDRESLISSKISLLLSRNEEYAKLLSKYIPATPLSPFSNFIKKYHSTSKHFSMNSLSADELRDDRIFYVNSLNISPSKAVCGSLLRNWHEIPGRDRSPTREDEMEKSSIICSQTDGSQGSNRNQNDVESCETRLRTDLQNTMSTEVFFKAQTCSDREEGSATGDNHPTSFIARSTINQSSEEIVLIPLTHSSSSQDGSRGSRKNKRSMLAHDDTTTKPCIETETQHSDEILFRSQMQAGTEIVFGHITTESSESSIPRSGVTRGSRTSTGTRTSCSDIRIVEPFTTSTSSGGNTVRSRVMAQKSGVEVAADMQKQFSEEVVLGTLTLSDKNSGNLKSSSDMFATSSENSHTKSSVMRGGEKVLEIEALPCSEQVIFEDLTQNLYNTRKTVDVSHISEHDDIDYGYELVNCHSPVELQKPNSGLNEDATIIVEEVEPEQLLSKVMESQRNAETDDTVTISSSPEQSSLVHEISSKRQSDDHLGEKSLAKDCLVVPEVLHRSITPDLFDYSDEDSPTNYSPYKEIEAEKIDVKKPIADCVDLLQSSEDEIDRQELPENVSKNDDMHVTCSASTVSFADVQANESDLNVTGYVEHILNRNSSFKEAHVKSYFNPPKMCDDNNVSEISPYKEIEAEKNDVEKPIPDCVHLLESSEDEIDRQELPENVSKNNDIHVTCSASKVSFADIQANESDLNITGYVEHILNRNSSFKEDHVKSYFNPSKMSDGNNASEIYDESKNCLGNDKDFEVINLSQESVSDEELNYSSIFSNNQLQNQGVKKRLDYYDLSDSEEEEVKNTLSPKKSFETDNCDDISLTPLPETRVMLAHLQAKYSSASPEKHDISPLDDSLNILLEDTAILNTIENQAVEESCTSRDNETNSHSSAKKTPSSNSNLLVKTANVTPMANYEAMDTPKIVKELDKFGLKPLKRQRGATLLKHIYESTHPMAVPEQTSSSSEDESCKSLPKRRKKLTQETENCSESSNSQETGRRHSEVQARTENVAEESELIFERTQSKKTHSCRIPLQVVWHNFVESNPNIQENILLYEPLQLEVLHSLLKEQGYKFNIQDLLTFLDKKCITIRTGSGQNRHRRKKQTVS